MPAFDGRAALSTWLYTIARNTCLSAVRAESYRKTSPLDESSQPVVANTVLRDVALDQCKAPAYLLLTLIQREFTPC